MKQLAILLVLAGAVVVTWRLSRGEADATERSLPVQQAAGMTPNRAPTLKTGPSQADKAEQNPKTTELPTRAYPVPANATAGEIEQMAREALKYAPTALLSQQLGWRVDGPRAAFLARWYGEKQSAERQFLDDLAGDDGQPEGEPILRKFNEATERWRKELVAELGMAGAQQVAKQIRLFKYELPKGGWYRIDASGRKIVDSVNDGPGR